MCGLAGSFGLPLEVAGPAVERMRRALLHRGPDDHGTEVLRINAFQHPVVLAHNRLSIIDLSPAGHQPMFRDGKRLALSYNGEVYNFRELRAELERGGSQFLTGSDSEVILAAYQAWGVESVRHMRGMFAWALADLDKGQVWLCRDRLGIKPLYVARPAAGGLIFASEVRALLAAGRELVPPRASPAAIESFLAQGMVCGFDSIVEKVSLLPPATSLVLDWAGQEVERRRYWQLPFRRATEENGVNRAKAVKQLHETLREAVQLHLIADVPLGIFLSSGVDSSAIATVASEVHRGGIHTLSVGFDQPEFDETREASELAHQLRTEHTILTLTGAELLSDIEQVFAALDQPTVDGFNTYVVSRAARKAGLTVALSGLGGDELFGGYASFRDVPRATALRRLLPFSIRLPESAHDWACRIGGRGAAKAMELLARPASTLESAFACSATARSNRWRMPSATFAVTILVSASAAPCDSASSAAATAGSTGASAGFRPVNGSPSPARWMRTSVSKKDRSARAFACGPSLRTARASAKAPRMAASSPGRTQRRTGVTSPSSSARWAALTTGPFMVSQCARAGEAVTASASTRAAAVPIARLSVLTCPPRFSWV